MISRSDEFRTPVNGHIKSRQANPRMLAAFASVLNVSPELTAFQAATLQDASTYLWVPEYPSIITTRAAECQLGSKGKDTIPMQPTEHS